MTRPEPDVAAHVEEITRRVQGSDVGFGIWFGTEKGWLMVAGFDAALTQHPQALLVATGVAALVVVILIACAMDVFIGWAERDVPPAGPLGGPPRPEPLSDTRALVMQRHARRLREDEVRR